MNLREKINEDLKASMKSGDKTRTETIRSIRALILEYEKSGTNKEMDAETELKLLTGAAKKRKESIEQFANAGRTELVEKEEAELKIIQEYLPKQLSEEEAFEVVKKLAAENSLSSKADFAKLMPMAIKELKGKADGKIVKSLVEKILQ
jgi:uncharacterized protein YqeY